MTIIHALLQSKELNGNKNTFKVALLFVEWLELIQL